MSILTPEIDTSYLIIRPGTSVQRSGSIFGILYLLPDTMAMQRGQSTQIQRTSIPQINWEKRRDIPVTILAWIAIIGIVFWSLSHISRSLLVIVIAAVIAYALYPAVKFLRRFIPGILAILFVYVVVFSLIGIFLYFVIDTANVELRTLAHNLRSWLTPQHGAHQSAALASLSQFGMTQDQLSQLSRELTSQAEQLTHSIVPFIRGIFSSILDMLLVAVISIYFLIDGARSIRWLSHNTPGEYRNRVTFVVSTFERVIGGYIRGQIILAVIIGVLIGIGMTVLHVPYAVLLGVLAFLLAFIPIIGTIVSGAICVIMGLTQGLGIAVLVLVYFIVMHVIEGDILGPRIVGRAIGLSPLISIIALLIGTELYGIIGALFASPIAGVVQAIIVTLWTEWKTSHPLQFNQAQKSIGKEVRQSVGNTSFSSKSRKHT